VPSQGTPAKTIGQQEYQQYRQQDPRWRALRCAVCLRAGGRCEICLRFKGVDCAHLTYERIFNERLTDLLWLCRRCHRALDAALGFDS
jgi:hypothetical protein